MKRAGHPARFAARLRGANEYPETRGQVARHRGAGQGRHREAPPALLHLRLRALLRLPPEDAAT